MVATEREEAMMEHLRANPEKAKSLLKEAQARSIAEIKVTYNDAVSAYSCTKARLDSIVDGLVALKESGSDEDSVEFQQAYVDGEKEWDRLNYEFSLQHGRRYDAYEQEVERCKASYKKLKSLILQ